VSEAIIDRRKNVINKVEISIIEAAIKRLNFIIVNNKNTIIVAIKRLYINIIANLMAIIVTKLRST
jgi:hypothetical protein